MQAMQQHLFHIAPQQLEAALTKISAASGSFGSSDPGGMFSAVATKLPKPTCSVGSNIGFSESLVTFVRLFFDACYDVYQSERLYSIKYTKAHTFIYLSCNHFGNKKKVQKRHTISHYKVKNKIE